MLVTCCNAVDDYVSAFQAFCKVDQLWLAKVILRESELSFAVFTPGVHALSLLLSVKDDTDGMLASAGDVQHWHVGNCVHECGL